MALNFTSPINTLGYGVVSLNILRELDALGVEPALWLVGHQAEAHPENGPMIQRCLDRTRLYDWTAPSLRIFHQFDLAQHVGQAARWGFPIFELDKFKPNEVHHLKSQDGLFVTSQWAKEVVGKAIRDDLLPVVVTPLGVDRDIFNENVPSPASPDITRFFNCGKWEVRKGHDVIVEAFNRAFEKGDKVELWMNCHNPCFNDPAKYRAYNSQWESSYKTSKLGEKILISPTRLPTQYDVARMMAIMDCGVFPARAEGWNLELGEMLSMGKHVITTGYAAHLEFCDDANSLLIPYRASEPAHDGEWFKADDPAWCGQPGEWMELGEDEIEILVHHMRSIHKCKQDGELGLNTAGINMMKHFTWRRTAEIIRETLEV
jgi:glycosyltransferase involved in cell wall biosynthesis